MRYLLDTQLLAELVHSKQGEWVANWFDVLEEQDIFLSAITIGEIIKGIERMENPEQQGYLLRWLREDLLVRFHGRVLPVDMNVIGEWGRLAAKYEKAGKKLSTLDGLIAATAKVEGLVLLTRSVDDFSDAGIEVSDPRQG